jgi:hypothetical protein
VVKAGAVVGVTDVHARTFPDRIEPLEDLDIFGVVLLGFCHVEFALGAQEGATFKALISREF